MTDTVGEIGVALRGAMNGLRFCHRWIASVLLVPAAAGAHHSRTQYDGSEIQEIQGELIAVSWANPHAAFSVRVTSASGDTATWQLESWGSPYVLSRMGVTRGPVRRRQPGAPCRTRLDSGAQSILADEHAATGRYGSGADDRRRRVLEQPTGRRALPVAERGDLDGRRRGPRALPRLEHGADGTGPRQPHHADASVRSRLANPSTSHGASS